MCELERRFSLISRAVQRNDLSYQCNLLSYFFCRWSITVNFRAIPRITFIADSFQVPQNIFFTVQRQIQNCLNDDSNLVILISFYLFNKSERKWQICHLGSASKHFQRNLIKSICLLPPLRAAGQDYKMCNDKSFEVKWNTCPETSEWWEMGEQRY